MNHTKMILAACALLGLANVATAENIDVFPTYCDFGDVLVGDSDTKTFTIEADGAAAGDTSVVYSVGILEDTDGAFALDLGGATDLPWILRMGEGMVPDVQEFDIMFEPPHTGTFSARLDISSTHIATPWNITLDGHSSGVVPEPGSLAIWSVLAAGGIGAGWWRRRRRAYARDG